MEENRAEFKSARYKMSICGASSCSLPNAKASTYILKHQAYGKKKQTITSTKLNTKHKIVFSGFLYFLCIVYIFFSVSMTRNTLKKIRNRFLISRPEHMQQTSVHMQASDFYQMPQTQRSGKPEPFISTFLLMLGTLWQRCQPTHRGQFAYFLTLSCFASLSLVTFSSWLLHFHKFKWQV